MKNAGKRWTDEEQKIMIDAFRNGVSIDELTSHLGRSWTAIFMRLQKVLMCLSPSEYVVKHRGQANDFNCGMCDNCDWNCPFA